MATKRKRRPVSFAAELLKPPVRLDASEAVIDRLVMVIDHLQLRDKDGVRRFHKFKPEEEKTGKKRDHESPSTAAEWRKVAADLVAHAEDDDEKLFELVERDPRYLASPLVIARVLEWRARVVLSRYTRGTSAKRAAEKPNVDFDSQEKLNRLGSAISSSGRSGSSSHISSADVVDAEAYVRERVDLAVKLVNGGVRNAVELAKRVDLTGYQVQLEELIVKPKARATVVTEILKAWFGTEAIERHRRLANRLSLEPRD